MSLVNNISNITDLRILLSYWNLSLAFFYYKAEFLELRFDLAVLLNFRKKREKNSNDLQNIHYDRKSQSFEMFYCKR